MKKLTLFLVALAMLLVACKPEIEKPTVVTKSVGEVTETTAKVVGQVTADGGAEVTERGVCWNTEGTPEVIDYRTVDGKGVGTYESNMTDLKDNTTYYVRAYAINEKGVSYGEELTLTTKKEIELPTVTTAEVKDITETTAVSGGEVTSDGGGEVTARGICWSTSQNPTIEDDKTTNGSGVGSFTSQIPDLVPNTQYYVRAYATNEAGTSYGEEKTFTTLEVIPEEPGDEPEEPGDEPEEPGDEPEEPGDEPEQPGDEPEEPGDEPEEPGDEPEEPGDEPEEPGDEPEEPGDEPEEPGDEPETPEQPEEVAPEVTTAEVTGITVNSAVCGGEVISGGDAVIVARGVCWNTSGQPTVSDTYTMDGSNIGSYTSNMTNLEQNTTYYVRAYATNVKGVTAYGEEVIFTTLEKLLPEVTTATEVTEITVNSAVCGGEVTFNGNVSVTARGICWSTSQNPTIEDNKTEDGSGLGSFTSSMTNLEHNTAYYVRAYATNEVGIAYGEEVSFTTLPIEGTTNGHSWVDLGLPSGKKWATCNVGATSPEEYGDYFAWGETSTKETYTEDNCPTYGLSISELQSQGYIDGEGNLTVQYDAATANWGGDWRMPTKAEYNELLNNCTWEWTTQNSVNGYKVKGPSGASIFLPAAGGYHLSLFSAGSYGYYWSSTPLDYGGSYDGYAYGLYFHSSGHDISYNYRYIGHSVRSVLE